MAPGAFNVKTILRIGGVLLALAFIAASAFHMRREYLVHVPLPQPPVSDLAASAGRFYFAYGANMSSRYLYNARGVLPLHREPTAVANYEVRFLGPGLNLLEPAFAYLVPAEGKVSHGVLYRVTANDLEKIKSSEGVEYEWTTVSTMSSDGKAIPAQTLTRLDGRVGKPSTRYLNILVEGAAENGLPVEYVAGLRREPSVYVPVASELMGDILLAYVMQQSAKCNSLLLC
jgi:hypothetical protein